MLNSSVAYIAGRLCVDAVPVDEIALRVGTPVYIYSLRRILDNLERIRAAFPGAHLHYSAKANANLAVLRTLIEAGAGIDAVSAGEIYRALTAGCPPERIVFAGVGKTMDELRYALDAHIGLFNIENEDELDRLNALAEQMGRTARAALRFNPDVPASTIPHIATGHKSAKFGLNADAAARLLAQRSRFAHVEIVGVHIHIGSQLGDTQATAEAAERALELIAPYPDIRTLDIGGGFPVAYQADQHFPTPAEFADVLLPLVEGCELILEPGRSVVADAGILVTQVLYTKQQGGEDFVIVDAGMTELIRPMLYDAHHEIVPVRLAAAPSQATMPLIVGPVCETTDRFGHASAMSPPAVGDLLAILTAGAYGMVMASSYNARPRPAEVVVEPNNVAWRVARRRETLAELVAGEID
jgi:diaminopimelate decarboxylase